MSTTTVKRSLAKADRDAHAFRELFPNDCFLVWEIAGSVRRRRADVGDIEHVIIPAFGDVAAGGMFDDTIRVNLLWHHLDNLIADGTLTKHVYETVRGDQFRRGDVYRGVDFRGFNHEIFLATAENFGSTLLIRTGPADYSRNFVDRFLRGGLYRQQGGNLIHVKTGDIIPVPDEATYYRMAGLPFVTPERRDA